MILNWSTLLYGVLSLGFGSFLCLLPYDFIHTSVSLSLLEWRGQSFHPIEPRQDFLLPRFELCTAVSFHIILIATPWDKKELLSSPLCWKGNWGLGSWKLAHGHTTSKWQNWKWTQSARLRVLHHPRDQAQLSGEPQWLHLGIQSRSHSRLWFLPHSFFLLLTVSLESQSFALVVLLSQQLSHSQPTG